MPTSLEIISERVNTLLKSEQITQAKLASKSNLSRSTISKILNKQKVSPESLMEVAKALNTTVDYLHGLNDEKDLTEYALNFMLEHIRVYANKSYYGSDMPVPMVLISQPIVDYIEEVYRIGIDKYISSEDQEKRMKDAESKVKCAIRNGTISTERTGVALIDLRYMTDEMIKTFNEQKLLVK